MASSAAILHAASAWPCEVPMDHFGLYLLRGADCVEQCAKHALYHLMRDDGILNLAGSQDDRALVLDDVRDSFRLFDFLEDYLVAPLSFITFRPLPITASQKAKMIEEFYCIDEVLAKCWFGDRLSKLDVDTTLERTEGGGNGAVSGTFGKNPDPTFPCPDEDRAGVEDADEREDATEEYLERHWLNYRRVCRTITGGYRTKDGSPGLPSDMKIRSAVYEQFLLSEELSQEYSTLVFGYEHHLNHPLLLSFSWAEIQSLCEALQLWCGPNQLTLSDSFCYEITKLRTVLLDSKLTSELQQAVVGDAPTRKWTSPLHLAGSDAGEGTGGRVMSRLTNPMSSSGLSNHASGSSATLDQQGMSNSNAGNGRAASMSKSNGGSVVNTPNTVEPTAAGTATATPGSPIGGPSAPPTPPMHQGSTPSLALSGSQRQFAAATPRFSRRMASDFPSIVKALSRMCAAIATKRDVREAIDVFAEKIVGPFLGGAQLSQLLPDAQGVVASFPMSAMHGAVQGGATAASTPQTRSHMASPQPQTAAGGAGKRSSGGTPQVVTPVTSRSPAQLMTPTTVNSPLGPGSSNGASPATATPSVAAPSTAVPLQELSLLLATIPTALSSIASFPNDDVAAKADFDKAMANFFLGLRLIVQFCLLHASTGV